jgi:hypothetical protein
VAARLGTHPTIGNEICESSEVLFYQRRTLSIWDLVARIYISSCSLNIKIGFEHIYREAGTALPPYHDLLPLPGLCRPYVLQ